MYLSTNVYLPRINPYITLAGMAQSVRSYSTGETSREKVDILFFWWMLTRGDQDGFCSLKFEEQTEQLSVFLASQVAKRFLGIKDRA